MCYAGRWLHERKGKGKKNKGQLFPLRKMVADDASRYPVVERVDVVCDYGCEKVRSVDGRNKLCNKKRAKSHPACWASRILPSMRWHVYWIKDHEASGLPAIKPIPVKTLKGETRVGVTRGFNKTNIWQTGDSGIHFSQGSEERE